MVEIDDAMRRALLAREGPPIGARELVLAGVRRRVGEGGPEPDEDPDGDADGDPGSDLLGGSSTPTGASATWWAKVVAATLTTTATGLVALRVAVVGVRALEGETVEVDAHVEPAPLEHEGDTTIGPRPDEGSIDAGRAAVVEPETTTPRARARPPAEPHVVAASEDATLAEELALVANAKRLRAAAPKDALAELERHRERFPTGALAPERDVLRIEISCALGRVVQAEQLRERFLVEHADSPLLARVRVGCREPGTETRRSGDE